MADTQLCCALDRARPCACAWRNRISYPNQSLNPFLTSCLSCSDLIRHRAPARRCDLSSVYCLLTGCHLAALDLSFGCLRAGSDLVRTPPKPPPREIDYATPHQGGLLDGSKRLKTSRRCLQDKLRCSKKPVRSPKEPQDQEAPKSPQDAPRRLQDTILVHFWRQNGSQLAPKSNQKRILY